MFINNIFDILIVYLTKSLIELHLFEVSILWQDSMTSLSYFNN